MTADSTYDQLRTFQRKLFKRGVFVERTFGKLCEGGCDPERLLGFLFVVSVLAAHGDLASHRVGSAEVKKLTKGLLSLADLVERVNSTSLNPKIDLISAPKDHQRDPVRAQVAKFYDMLPAIMRVYSLHLKRYVVFHRSLFKRMRSVHFETVQLLIFAEKSTGSPRYNDISELITEGYFAVGGSESLLPAFFSADGLAKLKQRTAKFRLTPRS